MKVIRIFVLLYCSAFLNCKTSTSSQDTILAEAFLIQEEALVIAGELTKIIQDKMMLDTSSIFREQGTTILESIKEWKHNMVAIPGAEHNHDGHDHGHDHDHDHSHHDSASHLTPEEILNVQKEWKNYIVALKETVQ